MRLFEERKCFSEVSNFISLCFCTYTKVVEVFVVSVPDLNGALRKEALQVLPNDNLFAGLHNFFVVWVTSAKFGPYVRNMKFST